jgi:hypothetical protein
VVSDNGGTDVAALIERLENPSGTRCPVRNGDRRCLGDAAHDTHYFLPDEDIQEAALGRVLKAALGGSDPSPGAYVVGAFEQRYDDDGWPLSGITVDSVAASPVPPVVPDSEALSSLPASMLRPDDGAWYDKDDPDDQPSGSGVVPDKPPLASTPCCRHCARAWEVYGECYGPHSSPCRDCNAFVPAVTDDEAAAKVIELTLQQHAVSPNDIISDLRSAGFLIVHHTKET